MTGINECPFPSKRQQLRPELQDRRVSPVAALRRLVGLLRALLLVLIVISPWKEMITSILERVYHRKVELRQEEQDSEQEERNRRRAKGRKTYARMEIQWERVRIRYRWRMERKELREVGEPVWRVGNSRSVLRM